MMLCFQIGRVRTEWKAITEMSKPCSKSKDQVRVRKNRNLVAKNNSHHGGYHSPSKYTRRRKYLPAYLGPGRPANDRFETDWARAMTMVNFNLDDVHYLEG